MKKIISKLVITIIFLTFPFVVTATDGYDYYYSGGKKVFLERNPDKICVLTPKVETNYTSAETDLRNLNKTIIKSTNSYELIVYEKPTTIQDSLFINLIQPKQTDSTKSIIQYCYFDTNGLELIPTRGLYVKLKKESDIGLLQEFAEKHYLDLIEQNKYMPLWFTLSITPNSNKTVIEIVNLLHNSGKFHACEPDFITESMEISWDKNIDDQWGLYNTTNDSIDINISSAWNLATGKGVKVAVLDGDGIDLTHPDLKENITITYDTETNDEIVSQPSNNHATIIGGIIASVRNNGICTAGVAPDAELIPIKVISNQQEYSAMKRADGINWAWKNNIDIINCSWNSYDISPLREAIDSALYRGRNGKGCIIVKSAGNLGYTSGDSINGNLTFPGTYKNEILVVGAINNLGNRATFSSYGAKLDIVAPGQQIYSTNIGGNIIFGQGTSYAAPFVSGLAALILERNPDLTGQQVRDIIEQNTTKVGDIPYTTIESRPNGTWNEEYGYGLIDAYKALLATPREEENY